MKLSIAIIFLVTFFNSGILPGHQAHYEKKSNGISKTEIVTTSDDPSDNELISIPEDLNNIHMCCCSNPFCMGSGSECRCTSDNSKQEMSCKTHCEDFSKNIIIGNQNTKNQIVHNLFSAINVSFIKTDTHKTKISQRILSQSVPAYISLHSFLI